MIKYINEWKRLDYNQETEVLVLALMNVPSLLCHSL